MWDLLQVHHPSLTLQGYLSKADVFASPSVL